MPKGKGYNNPQTPKVTHGGGSGPKMQTGGVDLTKGYKTLGDAGRSPHAVALNPPGKAGKR